MDEKSLAQPHDHLFKLLLEQPGVAGALLRERLPRTISARLAGTEPELLPGTYVSKELGETQSDRLYRVELRDGGAAYLYCLVEHKSAPDPRIGVQLLGYLTAIWERLDRDAGGRGKLPMVVPLVVYHGATRWRGPRRFSEGLEAGEEERSLLLDFPFDVLDVGHVEVPALSAEPHLRGGLLLLRYSVRFPEEHPVEALARMLEDLRGMSEAFLAAAGTYMFSQYLPAELGVLREAAHRAMPEKEERMVTRAMAEALAEGMEKGLEKGLEEGLEKGRVRGKAEVLRRQLARKLGLLPEGLSARIENASEADLDLWSDRVLDAKSVEDVFGPEGR